MLKIKDLKVNYGGIEAVKGISFEVPEKSIVTLELMVGSAANLWLGWAIWDYTDLRFHYLGQISLGFALIWYFLCSLFFGIAGWICTGAKKREPQMRLSSFRIAGAPQGAAIEKIKLRKPFRRPCR